MTFHDQKLCKSTTDRHWISNSCKLSATVGDIWRQKIGCLLKDAASCPWLPAIQCIVNHWFLHYS